jgi:SAM-dependent methyltransferase
LSLNDPGVVRAEYETECGLVGRIGAYRFADGPDARELALAAVGEADSRRVLEVGCGTGELAERLVRELEVELVALDQSRRMVELTAARGVDARVADVQDLPFEAGTFDCALAAWMLYHVPDVERALGELARVLRPGGRLVAVTNSIEHLRELKELVGAPRAPSAFSAENGEQLLGSHFDRVERREAYGWIDFPGPEEVQEYVDATRTLWPGARPVVELGAPLRVRTAPVIFVATK